MKLERLKGSLRLQFGFANDTLWLSGAVFKSHCDLLQRLLLVGSLHALP